MRVLLAGCLLAAAGTAQETARETWPFESLFDGSTLAGWRGDPAVWSVRDGCIVGSTVGAPIRENTFLVLEGRTPAHFTLRARVRVDGDNNSGIQYRSRVLEGDGFRVAGYQCDVHGAPAHFGMLYDEGGHSGIVARAGQFVRWTDDGVRVLGDVASVRQLDVSQWHDVAIFACGDLVWHKVDGQLTAVQDRRHGAPRSGCIALQVHAGAPMTVSWRDVKIIEYADEAAFARDFNMPRAVRALLRREQLQAAAPRGATPLWLWDASPEDGEELFFRRTFALAEVPANARLAVACDNHCRLYVNGEKVGEGDAWERPVVVGVAKALRPGDNVLAVHGWNDGGPAGLAARLSWQLDGTEHEIVSDASWRYSADDPDGWNALPFDDAHWSPTTVLAAVGVPKAPWTRVHGAETFSTASDPFAPQVALLDTSVVASSPDDQVDIVRLLDVPRALGSWVSLCTAPKGRLYASDQSAGLYRIVPAAEVGELTTIERVPVELGGAHGLLWFRDSLYAVVNGKTSGLYRLTDTNGDDVLDRVELLQALEGEGEHGPHSVVVAPDDKNLLVVCGNQTKLPPLAASRVPKNWAEDRLLPRLDDPNPYWEGISPPGGWVCQCDADGKQWELICCGFRNPYDLAVLESGQVVTFDSDMEWDMGLPWYRPTRLLAVQSGVDYGWRIGSAKWPADYPECPRSIVDIGPGSPTGMIAVGDGVLLLDWTFGTVYEHRAGEGVRPLVAGVPFPVADGAYDNRDLYLVTGGRGLPSRVLRLRYAVGGGGGLVETVAESPAPSPHDRIHSRAAERQPALRALVGRGRNGTNADLQPVLDALGQLPFAPLGHEDRIAWLRVHALALLRLGPANDAQRATVAQRLLPLFPTGDERQDRDLAELLAYVDAPGFLDQAVPLLSPMRPSPVPEWANVAQQADVYGDQYGGVIRAMVANMPPIGQIAIADALRTVEHGWTLDQRRTFFAFLGEARTRKGGASYDGYLKKIIDAAWATCSPAEQQALADVVGKAKADAPKFHATPPKGPGRDWQLADADALLRDGLAGLEGRDLAAGRNLFHAASCASCHYFAGEGGNHGPDLTSLGNKFSARDVLEAILEPGRVVSDQYTGQVLTKKDGSTLFGFAVKGHHGDTEVWEVMPAAADAVPVRVPVADVQKVERSPLSPMPGDLVDRLSADELRDLLAFLLLRGKAPAPADGDAAGRGR